MLARLLTATLLSLALVAAVLANDLTPRQRQAKLARQAAIAMRVHAVRNAEREAALTAQIVQLAQNDPPALWFWAHSSPWLKAVVVAGATSLFALAAMAWLAARPDRGASRA